MSYGFSGLLFAIAGACAASRPASPPPASPPVVLVAAPPQPAIPTRQPTLPPPAPDKITAPPATWIEFTPDDHGFTARFEKPPTPARDRGNNPRYVVQHDASVFSVGVIDLTVERSASTTAAAIADDSAAPIADRTKYVQVRSVSSANASWVVRDVWFRADALGDGVPWYGRKRITVSTTAPFRLVAATAMVGLPGDEPLADAFVENVVAAERR